MTTGRQFFKMSGSGNDFIMVDARDEPVGSLADPKRIKQLCARGTGIGADGVVFLERTRRAAIRLVYLNSDGSDADFCGNATLCTTRLAAELQAADPAGMTIETDAGVISSRMLEDGPEIDFPPLTDLALSLATVSPGAGELRLGYAIAGVPHIVVLVDGGADVLERVDIVGRGRKLRLDKAFRNGANVNFLARASRGSKDHWLIRTYERGVEGETLACGSGAVASAALLLAWGESPSTVSIQSRSGSRSRVRFADGDHAHASLAGPASLVFTGQFADL